MSGEPARRNGALSGQRGRGAEYRALFHLRDDGYFATKTPASKSQQGPVDIVAVKPGQVLFVQVKLNSLLRPAEWNALLALAEQFGAVPVLAECRTRKPVRWWRLAGRKSGALGVRQPMVPFVLDEVIAHPGGGAHVCSCGRSAFATPVVTS